MEEQPSEEPKAMSTGRTRRKWRPLLFVAAVFAGLILSYQGIIFRLGFFLYFGVLIAAPIICGILLARDHYKGKQAATYWREKWRNDNRDAERTLLRPSRGADSDVLLRHATFNKGPDEHGLLRPEGFGDNTPE